MVDPLHAPSTAHQTRRKSALTEGSTISRLKAYDAAQCDAILSATLNAGIGMIVRSTPDALRGRALLYEARKGNPAYANLQIRFSPDNPDTELWIFTANETNETNDETLVESSAEIPI